MSEAVKQGWSWPAFFFGPFWAMVKKLWVLGVLVLIGVMVLSAGSKEIFPLIALVPYIYCGLNGNGWREKNLISRGYEVVDAVSAETPEGAMALHIKAVTVDH